MAATRGGKVVYTDNPNPHPQKGDAPTTGVPTNPVSPNTLSKSAAEYMKETD